MGLRSKTYSLDERVHAALDELKAQWGSYNKALLEMLVPNNDAPEEEPVGGDGNGRREAAANAMAEAEAEDSRPKNAQCRHCGERFAGPRSASICPECKSTGHTLAPAECPACAERGTGAL